MHAAPENVQHFPRYFDGYDKILKKFVDRDLRESKTFEVPKRNV